jgi:hypothetical protein
MQPHIRRSTPLFFFQKPALVAVRSNLLTATSRPYPACDQSPGLPPIIPKLPTLMYVKIAADIPEDA